MKRDKYTCPCCGFCTENKSHMYIHLYKLKKPCPCTKAKIELTEEVKQDILKNRIYHPPKEDKPATINQTINNYNTVNNFIGNLDTMYKLNKYIDYKKIDLVDFSQSVEDKYANTTQLLEENKTKISLKQDDFLEIVNSVSNITDIEKFNLLYDSKSNKVKLYEEGEWQEFIATNGIKKIVETIKDSYLDSYELYLIRNMKCQTLTLHKRSKFRDNLEEYYRFLIAFDLEPYCKDKNNYEILYNIDDEKHDTFVESSNVEAYSIEEECCKIYRNMKESRKNISQCNKIVKEIKDIIKRNTQVNASEINKRVLDLFSSDPLFKKTIIP